MTVARIKKRADFVAVQTGGRSKAASAFVILASPGGEALCFGYTASKKLGNAVKRNRAKRRMKEAVHLLLKSCPGLPAGRVVLIARQQALTQPLPKMLHSLAEHLPELLK